MMLRWQHDGYPHRCCWWGPESPLVIVVPGSIAHADNCAMLGTPVPDGLVSYLQPDTMYLAIP